MTRYVVVSILAALEIGGAFGAASAEIHSISDTSMTLDLEVEVVESVQAAVAHLSFDGKSDITLPLLDRDGGTFGIRTELEPLNYLVVFEAIGDEGGLSDPFSLRDMGADFDDGVAGGAGGDDDGLSDQTRQAGWLALALVAASLSALAFWVLGGRDKKVSAADEEE